MLQASSLSTFCMHLLSLKCGILNVKINNLKKGKKWENYNKKNKSQFYFTAVSFSCDQKVCKTSIQKTVMCVYVQYDYFFVM